ncbi:hypothetical protein BGX29_010122 [Mortierella sp. GBA35]|nr:hypothetical protein BGX29_010122 [Mortierella sp. GBA35]
MSTTFPLPLECRQQIVSHLLEHREANALASMLRVCTVTLPILYRDPFSVHPFIIKWGVNNRKTRNDLATLPRTLLLSLPANNTCVTNFLRAACLQTQDQNDNNTGPTKKETPRQESSPIRLPNYSFVAIAAFDHLYREIGDIFRTDDLDWNLDFMAFAERTGLKHRYLDEEPFSRFIRFQYEVVIAVAASRDLRRDLTWALCSNAEHIQTLGIPLLDISVIWLSSIGSRHQEERTRHLEEMIVFVQEHRRQHPSVLRKARCANDRVAREPCPDEYQLRLLQILPPLFKPQYLDHRSWAQFVASVASTDLTFVEFVDHGTEVGATILDDNDDDGSANAEQEEDDSEESLSSSVAAAAAAALPRPVWTWDWELYNLTHLRLTSEFAYRFQFRMLNGTPSLSYFRVDINSSSRAHERTVGIADLVKPGYQHPALEQFLVDERQQQQERRRRAVDNNWFYEEGEEEEGNTECKGDETEDWQEFEYVYVPVLKTFSLIGRWTLDYRTLQVLFGRVAPKIDCLCMTACTGFTVSEWVRSTSRHLDELQNAFATIPVRPCLIARAGLEEIPDRNLSQPAYRLVDQPANRVSIARARYSFR